jgi:5,10-methylenetetrahydromethanopterin reductase
VQHCVAKLQQFRDAGADEIATYGSTPGQNAELIDAWRNRTVAD